MEIICKERQDFLENMGASFPQKLLNAEDLPYSFIYCRKYGVISCQYAHHSLVMGAMVWLEGDPIEDISDWRTIFSLKNELFRNSLADIFLDTWDGAFFRSSGDITLITLSETAKISGHGLNSFEKRQTEHLRKVYIV